MKLGVDFEGTIIRYAVCAKSDGGDGHTIITTETLDEAKHELQLRINREKKKEVYDRYKILGHETNL